MAELAEELTLLLLSPDEWRDLGYQHGDPARNVLAAAFLAEDWVSGGPPPTVEVLRREMPKQSPGAPKRALEPLVASGRVERHGRSGLARAFAIGQAGQWRVVDRAGRQAILDRVAASLGGTTPPPLRDATVAALLFASRLWDRTGFDGPQPMPYVVLGPAPEPWGPTGARAQELAAGTVVPAGATQRDVLPLLARAVGAGDQVTHLR